MSIKLNLDGATTFTKHDSVKRCDHYWIDDNCYASVLTIKQLKK